MTVGASGVVAGAVGFFLALPVVSLEVFSPFLSLAFTSLPSSTLFAGIVTLPLVLSTVTPVGVFPSIFHSSFTFLTVSLVGLVSPSGV